MLPLAATLGFQMASEMFTASGKRTGVDQPVAVRSTRHRFETKRVHALPGAGAGVAGSFGRMDWKTTYFPSGVHAGEESGHCPENGATTGSLHRPLVMCDSRITVQCAALRVKKSVEPSGEKVGVPSFAGPEIIPGAKICSFGTVALSCAATEAAASPKDM